MSALDEAIAWQLRLDSNEAGEHKRQIVKAGHQRLSADSPALLAADAWSRGMLVADRMPLAQLLYRSGYLGVDKRLADLPISGSFSLRDTDLALDALTASLPVRIKRHSDGWVKVVSAAP